MASHTVYMITNTVNRKLYIGQTSKTVEERWKTHKYSMNNPARNHYKFTKALRKHGPEKFSHTVLQSGLTQGQADTLEQLLIEKHNSIGAGYNTAKGGRTPTGILTRKGDDNPCTDTSTYIFYSKTESFSGTADAFSKEFGLKRNSVRSLVTGRNARLFGWAMSKGALTSKPAKKNMQLPKKLQRIINTHLVSSPPVHLYNMVTERQYFGTPEALSILEGSDVTQCAKSLSRGTRYKQWCTYCPITKPLFRNWIHPQHGLVTDARPKDIALIDTSISVNILNQVARGNSRYKSHRNWRIFENNNRTVQ